MAVDAETGLEYAVKEFSKRRLTRKFGREIAALNAAHGAPDDALYLIRNEVAIMKKVSYLRKGGGDVDSSAIFQN